MVGGFASAFDLISSEYGWPDREILDLTLARMQQIVAAITLRKKGEVRDRKREISWAVRTISAFVAGGYMTEDKSGIDAAHNLSIEEIERQVMDSDLPEPPPEPKAGSTEALLRAFGGRP